MIFAHGLAVKGVAHANIGVVKICEPGDHSVRIKLKERLYRAYYILGICGDKPLQSFPFLTVIGLCQTAQLLVHIEAVTENRAFLKGQLAFQEIFQNVIGCGGECYLILILIVCYGDGGAV